MSDGRLRRQRDAGFVLITRSTGTFDGYAAGFAPQPCKQSVLIYIPGPNGTDLVGHEFDPDMKSHAYRIDVQGNRLTLWIDRVNVAHLDDDTFRVGTSVGLPDHAVPLTVLFFQVMPLP
jgi:hypothetical protein